LPPHCARKQQIGNIGARRDKNEYNSAKEYKQLRADFPDDRFMKGHRPDASPACFSGRGFVGALRHDIHLGPGLAKRYALSQAADHC
jgi:hypothetical protein